MSERPVAIVTGASSGIGAATGRALAADGYSVVLAARRVLRLEELAGQINANGGNALAVPTDITDVSAVDRLFETARVRYGRIDVLVNNAGVALGNDRLADGKTEQWHAMVNVNLFGVLYATRAALKVMLEQGTGHIVTIGSMTAESPPPTMAVYAAVKQSLYGLFDAVRQELDGTAIRVTVVVPGTTETEFAAVRRADPAAAARFYASTTPLQPDDVAAAILFALHQPARADVNKIVMRPTAQRR